MRYYVSITKKNSRPIVRIQGEGKTQDFPLSKRGCLTAGRYLYLQKQESWICSSSVDFPKEIHPEFRHDVHALLTEGWRNSHDAVTPSTEVVQEKRVADYEIRGNQFIAIAINVNDPKDAHYFTIDPDVNNNAFVRACGWAYEPED